MRTSNNDKASQPTNNGNSSNPTKDKPETEVMDIDQEKEKKNSVQFLPPNITRLDVKITVAENNDADLEVVATFWQLIQKLTEHIPDLKLLPWHEDSTLSPVSTRNNFPRAFATLKFYFQGVYPRAKGGALYGRIRLQSSQPIMENIKFISAWMKQQAHGLFPRAIQSEETTILGWLLYSSLSTDQQYLGETLSRESGVKIACRFRRIKQNRQDNSTPIKAIHLESSVQDSQKAKKYLTAVYGRQSSSPYPTGAMYKLMPSIQSIHNTPGIESLMIVIQRQSHFIKHSKTIRTWQFTSIDFRHPEIKLTLREMLACITWDDNAGISRPLILSTDNHFRNDGFNLTVHPKMENEARVLVSALYPYLRHVYGDKVNSLFTEDTVTSQSNYRWDPNIGGVVTEYDELIKAAAGDDWMDFAPTQVGTNSTEVCNMEAITATGKYALTRDGVSISDSVGTIQTNKTNRSSKRTRVSSQTENPSICSTMTIESRMLTMESEVGSISGMVKEIYKALHPNQPTSSPSRNFQQTLGGIQESNNDARKK